MVSSSAGVIQRHSLPKHIDLYIHIYVHVHICIFKIQHTYTNSIQHNEHTLIHMHVVVIPIIIITQDSNPFLSESLFISIYLDFSYLGFYCTFFGVSSLSYVLRVSRRVFCRVALCCFYAYTCDSKSIAGVLNGQAIPDHPITAHHLYAFPMAWGDYRCGGSTREKKCYSVMRTFASTINTGEKEN